VGAGSTHTELVSRNKHLRAVSVPYLMVMVAAAATSVTAAVFLMPTRVRSSRTTSPPLVMVKPLFTPASSSSL
jgi:hypothetical protein